jgi:sulfur-oxidizing protein SoxZ
MARRCSPKKKSKSRWAVAAVERRAPAFDTAQTQILKEKTMADPMRIRAQMAGAGATVRALMAHEMETGQRKDAAGKVIPAWHINEVTATHNGKSVMTAEWGPAVSKNPFLQFTLKSAKVGDKVAITWKDNRGDTRTDEATIS